MLFAEERSHPLAYIFDRVLCGLLGQLPARQAFLLVRVDLDHQRVGFFEDVLDCCLTYNVDLLGQRVAMLANSSLGFVERLDQVG